MHMYFLYHIWSSGCLLSLPVVMCVLGPVLSCYCYAIPGMTDSILSFLSCTIAKRGLYSYVCCSVINFPDRWYSCIYFCFQQLMWLPLLHCFSSFNVVSADPNSCLFSIIWFAYADCGLQFFYLVNVLLISYLYVSTRLSYIFLVTCDASYAVYSIRIIWSVWFFG